MARLLDCFSGFVSFGLGLDASIAAGRAEPGCESARQQALDLLEEARVAALALGRPAAAVESARFAMVAWIDEILARHPDCKAREGTPLQQQLFNSNNAHTEFFHHLSALAAGDGSEDGSRQQRCGIPRRAESSFRDECRARDPKCGTHSGRSAEQRLDRGHCKNH